MVASVGHPSRIPSQDRLGQAGNLGGLGELTCKDDLCGFAGVDPAAEDGDTLHLLGGDVGDHAPPAGDGVEILGRESFAMLDHEGVASTSARRPRPALAVRSVIQGTPRARSMPVAWPISMMYRSGSRR